MRFLNHWDLNTGELRNATAHLLAGFTVGLGASDQGRMGFDTTVGTGKLFGVWSGTAWVKLRDDWVASVAAAVGSPILIGGTAQNPTLDITLANGSFLVGNGSNVARASLKANIPISGFGTAGANIALGTYRITGLGDPVDPQDAATKAYVDATAQGLDVKGSVKCATTAALPAHTRSGNELTANANGAFSAQDGITLALNERILVKDEGSGTHLENGLYYLAIVGDAGTPWKLTRTTDADTSEQVTPGMYVWVEQGTVNADSGWVLTTDSPIVLNTTALTFAQFSGAGQLTMGNGLVKVGNTIHFAQSSAYSTNTIPYASGASAIGFITAGTANQVLRVPGAGGAPAFGAIDLAQAAAVTGLLGAANGGTGQNSSGWSGYAKVTAGTWSASASIPWSDVSSKPADLVTGSGADTRIAFWNGTNTLTSSANLTWQNNRFTVAGAVQLNLDGGAIAPYVKRNGSNGGLDIGKWDGATETLQWSIVGTTGILQSTGAQTIQTSTGNLTLATVAGNGNILLSPHGTGMVGVGVASPAAKLEVAGLARVTSNVNIPASGAGLEFLFQPSPVLGYINCYDRSSATLLNLTIQAAALTLATTSVTVNALAGTGTRVITGTAAGLLGAVTNGSDGTWLKLVAGAPAWAGITVSDIGSAADLTAHADGNLVVSSGGTGSVLVATSLNTIQGIKTTSTPQFARLGLGAAADATNIATFTSASMTADSKALNVAHTGAITGTGYGGYSSQTGASTTNVGLYVSASGATNNYGLIVESGNVGIGTAGPSSRLDVTVTGVSNAVTNAEGLSIINTTAAVANVTGDDGQQYSPALRWRGQGWKTDVTAASQPVDFRAYVIPVQGAAAPAGKWVLEAAINDGAYSNLVTVQSSGAVTISNLAGTGTRVITGTAAGLLGAVTNGSDGTWLKLVAGAPAWAAGDALTKSDDTNVTLTLGGSAATALLAAASITVGWTGTLAAARLNANVVQGVTNDTNVTGSIAAQNLTLGWTGTLASSRGGTGFGTYAANDLIYASAINTLSKLATVASRVLVTDGSGVISWGSSLPAGTKIDSKALVRKVTSTVASGASGNVDITHNLGTLDLIVMLRRVGGEYAMTTFTAISTTQVRLTFAVATTENLEAVIMG